MEILYFCNSNARIDSARELPERTNKNSKKMAKEIVETPLMKQYFEMKEKHPDAVLLFRVGDFYETFADDAV